MKNAKMVLTDSRKFKNKLQNLEKYFIHQLKDISLNYKQYQCADLLLSHNDISLM